MYKKTIILDVNWLDEVSGSTVEQAIEYLKTLNKSHILSCYLDGDTHGCDIVSRLRYDVPMTNAEILAQLETRYLKEIGVYSSAKQDHLKAGRTQRVESCERMLSKLYEKLADARLKYKE